MTNNISQSYIEIQDYSITLIQYNPNLDREINMIAQVIKASKKFSRGARKGRREKQDQKRNAKAAKDSQRYVKIFIEYRHYEEQKRRGNLLNDHKDSEQFNHEGQEALNDKNMNGSESTPTMTLYYLKIQIPFVHCFIMIPTKILSKCFN